MNYVFFDIECANCQYGQAKICSFGYVVCDEDFKVLEKEDWIVNPKAPFMLSGRGNRPYIKLAYSRDQFRRAPDFHGIYRKLCALFARKDCLYFGYAADNDASYLRSEFIRYALVPISFAYYDLQKLLHVALPREDNPAQLSLAGAVSLFCDEPDQAIHKSDDDAYMTMQVLKGIVDATGLSPVKLLEQYPVCRGDLKDGNVLIRIPEGKDLLVRSLGDKSDRISPKSDNRTIYTRFVRHVKPSGAEFPLWLRGKRVCIPEKYAERHYRNAIKLIQLICDCGGRYSLIPESCHIFITFPIYNDDGSPKECAEVQRIESDPKAKAQFYTPEQFLSMCGLGEEGLSKLPLPDIRYLLEERYAQAPKTSKPRRRAPVKNRERVTIIPEKKN